MYSITVIFVVIKHRRPRYPWATGKRKTLIRKIPLLWEILTVINMVNMSYEGSGRSFQYTRRISIDVN